MSLSELHFKVLIQNDKLSKHLIENIFKEFSLFKPQVMRGSFLSKASAIKYNESKLFSSLGKEYEKNDRFMLALEEERQLFIFKKSITTSMITGRIETKCDPNMVTQVISYVKGILEMYEGKGGYIHNAEDDFWQNNTDVQYVEIKGMSLAAYNVTPDPKFPNKKIIDIESNPGHSHLTNGYWFGSGWHMYFGNQYFQYIPKDVLLSFKDCFESKELENGAVQITLYEHVGDYNLPENRARQWAFRKHTGIDEVAHALMNSLKDENHDPSISIETETACKHGGVRLITYFYDPNGELIAKSKATYYKSYEIGTSGQIVWSREETI